MPKLISFSCFMLFWVFYELSGGSDFTPRERIVISQAPFARPNAQRSTYQRPIAATQAVNASYVPVSTEPLTAVRLSPNPPAETLVITPTPVRVPEIETSSPDVRIVAGSRVNLRRGPGTSHQVVDTLPYGTAAEVIAINDLGWAQIRLIESGKTGWMAARLLSEG